jgi:hypothetical protein
MKHTKSNLTLIVTLTTLTATSCLGGKDSGSASGGDGPSVSDGGSLSPSPKSGSGKNSCAKRSYGNPNFQCDCSEVEVDLPFNYTITSENLFLETVGGPLPTVISPWGAHTEPFTGHYNGNHKQDWQALYGGHRSELTELTPSNGNGLCEAGEECGVHKSKITSRPLNYVAPGNKFTITEVYITGVYSDRANELSSGIAWAVTGWLCNYRYKLGYIGTISPILRNKMINAGYADPYLETEAKGGLPGSSSFNPENLIKGAAIVLDKGDNVGEVMIRAEAIKDHPGYYKGWGGIGHQPYLPLEYNVDNKSLTDGKNTGIYALLSKELQNKLEDVFYADAKKGVDSLNFSSHLNLKWLWAAEMKLTASTATELNNYSSIFTWLGGWTENNSTRNCYRDETKYCDQGFTIFKIQKNTPFYDSSLYDSSEVSYLVNKTSGSRNEFGEVLSPSNIDDKSGTLLIKWRGTNQYQRIAFSVEEQNQWMKIRWGTEVRFPELAEPVSIPADSDSCDGEVVTCMDHNTHRL